MAGLKDTTVTGTLSVTGVATVGAHGAAATPQVVNVCYGTSTPGSATGIPEGTLYILYSA